MKRLLLGYVVAIVLACGSMYLAFAQGAPVAPDLNGHYNVEGKGSKGDYSGCAVIVQNGSAVFVRFYTAEDPNEPSTQGFGLIKDDRLVWGFQIGPNVGMGAIYRIEGDKLIGAYIEPDGTEYPETMTKGEHVDKPKGPTSVADLTVGAK